MAAEDLDTLLDTLYKRFPELALARRWHEAFGTDFPSALTGPGDPLVEAALEAGDESIQWPLSAMITPENSQSMWP